MNISFEQFRKLAYPGAIVPVIDTMPADLLTPVAVYLKMSKRSGASFLLESVEGGENLARFSFIGSGPQAVIRGTAGETFVTTADGTSSHDLNVYEYLKLHFKDHHLSETEGELPAFCGGAIGYFGFGSTRWFERSLNGGIKDEEPVSEVMLFRSVVAFDHVRQTINLISLAFVGDTPERDLELLFDRAVASNNEVRRTLDEESANIPASSITPTPKPNVQAVWSQPQFEQAVSHIKEAIAAGDCYQVVLSQRFNRPTAASAISIYRALRSMNPSPYMFLLRLPERDVIGASPEMLVRSRGVQLEYRPIAGTRPRGHTAEEDSFLASEMMQDAKEVAEHKMLVDLGRNDLGRVARFGTVKVERLMHVEKYSHVQHLVSNLTAQLRDGCDRFDALAACFPAGTVSGAPKVKAIEMIQDLEPESRGIYAGAVGYFDYSGNMDTCIAIRTLVLENGVARVQAGAGIVADSVPEMEFEETLNKAKVLLKAIESAEERGY